MFSKTPKAATLNATTLPCPDEAAQRRTRHLSVCQELIDIGMKLARAAAERALDSHEQAKAANTPHTPPVRDPDLTFNRHAAGVRQAVALEARVANNAFARPVAAAAAQDSASTDHKLQQFRSALDRGTLEDALTQLTDDHAESWQLQETFGDIIEDTLSAFPDDPLSAHFARACLALDIEPDLASLPPDLAALLEPAAPERWPRAEAA